MFKVILGGYYVFYVLCILEYPLQLLCGTDPLPELYRANKYKINDNFITKTGFQHMMMNLPEEVRISQV